MEIHVLRSNLKRRLDNMRIIKINHDRRYICNYANFKNGKREIF